MVDWHADDFAFSDGSSEHILETKRSGALTGVSILPNGDLRLAARLKGTGLSCAVHLNLVEGKCCAGKDFVPLLTDENGYFRYSFFGLFLQGFRPGRQIFREQLKVELTAQIELILSVLPEGAPLRLDSHQHTHLIPPIYRALKELLEEKGYTAEYLRIPTEPLSPFLRHPSVLLTTKPVNIVKNLVLKTCYAWDRLTAGKIPVPSAVFCGILFSGRMDAKRLRKVLPAFSKLAKKKGLPLEILFHPGSESREENCLDTRKTGFTAFYLSPGRQEEREALLSLTESDLT